MGTFSKTDYSLQCLSCGKEFDDKDWALSCSRHHNQPSFIRTVYKKKQLEVRGPEEGLYRFSDWLPVGRMLDGSSAPVTYRSEGLGKALGLKNLYITFSGYWPEKNALMKTGTFKETEAFSVCGRMTGDFRDVLVVASAGNTARAFGRVCSENRIPLLLFVPEDNINALWFDHQLDPCVKLVCTEKGSDYFDAIFYSRVAAAADGFQAEGGAKNVARRDGMATTMLSAVTTIGEIPDYYFQAVGSGTGAIAAWEANLRFLEDGRFGDKKTSLHLSQNSPFLLMAETWSKRSRDLLDLDPDAARKQVQIIDAKVLSNRQPPWSITGGLFDAMQDTDGQFYSMENHEAASARKMFEETEGNDISPAASVAVASLIQAVEKQAVREEDIISLNITGGGMQRFKNENKLYHLEPQLVLPLGTGEKEALEMIQTLF